jgi:hypothetical protein
MTNTRMIRAVLLAMLSLLPLSLGCDSGSPTAASPSAGGGAEVKAPAASLAPQVRPKDKVKGARTLTQIQPADARD